MSCVKICTKFERNQTIRIRVIDDLAQYRRRWHSRRFSGMRGPNCTRRPRKKYTI